MSTVWKDGVPWYDRALETAERAGIADQVNEIARTFLEGHRVLTYPDPGYINVRVQVGDVAAVLTPENIVVGFVMNAERYRASQKRSKGGKGKGRGPRSYEELHAMLLAEGYRVEPDSGHHSVVEVATGRQVSRLTSSASDVRQLANDTARLRKRLGVRLRARD